MIDQDFLTELQYVLLEPPDGGQSFPSEAWTRDEVIAAANAGERRLLQATFLVITRTEIPVGADVATLPADWLATVHVVWRQDATGVRTPLAPGDQAEADLADPDWEAGTDTPRLFLDTSDTDTLILRLMPIPASPGVVELLYVARPTPVNGNGRRFTVPDEYLSGVKYDALATLLNKVGRLQDPARAAYCRQRVAATTLAAEIILGGFA